MNIFDQVMDMEREGETLYRGFAKHAPEQGLAKIFNWLADQEKKHYETFLEMKKGKDAALAEDAVLRNIKDIFEAWKKGRPQFDSKTNQADLYRQALETEQKSAELYGAQAGISSSEAQKQLWLKIAAEEKRHEHILENIIEFVTKPEFWAENAEFSHLEKDYYL